MQFHGKTRPIILIFLALLAASLLAACDISLAGDVTPPPNYVPPTPAPTDSQQQAVVFPLVPPDPQMGKATYAEKCLPCHGATGLGDGPQASQLPNPPAPIGTADLARLSRPVDWFQTVTNGNLDRFMPGFTQSLDDRQRWDVVAYALTLSTTPDEFVLGKKIYSQNCASCHGDAGKGDGPQAAALNTRPGDWSKPDLLTQMSQADIVQLVVSGKGDMPALGDKLDENQRWAAAAYSQSLSFTSTTNPGENASSGAVNTPAANSQNPGSPSGSTTGGSTPVGSTPGAQTVLISGKVTNGTPGGKVPDGIKVTLTGFSGMNQIFSTPVDVNPDGTYQFNNVAFQSDYVYMVQADVNSVTFSSDVLHATDITGQKGNLPLQIYETSTDASVLKADRMHVFFDFSKTGIVQVVELFIITNPTDKMVVATSSDKAVLSFALPAGASNLQFQDSSIGARYIQTDAGFGDRDGVPPGQGNHQILFAYDMPYDQKLTLSLISPLPTDAAMVMIPEASVGLSSSQLTDAGNQSVQGMNFKLYETNTQLSAGQPLTFELNGPVGSGGTVSSTQSYLPLIVGGGIFVLALAAAAYWFFLLRKRNQPVSELLGEEDPDVEMLESSDGLVDAIIALDDLYQAGKLREPAYQERRAELKARLTETLQREKLN